MRFLEQKYVVVQLKNVWTNSKISHEELRGAQKASAEELAGKLQQARQGAGAIKAELEAQIEQLQEAQ